MAARLRRRRRERPHRSASAHDRLRRPVLAGGPRLRGRAGGSGDHRRHRPRHDRGVAAGRRRRPARGHVLHSRASRSRPCTPGAIIHMLAYFVNPDDGELMAFLGQSARRSPPAAVPHGRRPRLSRRACRSGAADEAAAGRVRTIARTSMARRCADSRGAREGHRRGVRSVSGRRAAGVRPRVKARRRRTSLRWSPEPAG